MDNEIMQTLSVIVSKLGDMENAINKNTQEIKEVSHKVDGLEHKVVGLEHKVDGLEHKVDGLEHKVETIDKKVTIIELTLENETNKKIDALFDGYSLVQENKQIILDRQTNLEHRVDKLESSLLNKN